MPEDPLPRWSAVVHSLRHHLSQVVLQPVEQKQEVNRPPVGLLVAQVSYPYRVV